MKCLVIGASGLVGGYLYQGLHNVSRDVIGTYNSHSVPGLIQLNLQASQEVKSFLEGLKPRIVFMPSAFTNVDACENEPETSYKTNVTGVVNCIEAACSIKAKVVFFSTDYVFDGESGPYTEQDQPNPLSQYGQQKLAVEQIIPTLTPDYLILRTTVVYGWEMRGRNFVYRLVHALRKDEQVRAPEDQIGTPTYGKDLANAAILLALQDFAGLFHVAGPDLVDRYSFSRTAAKIFSLPEALIVPVKTKELGQIAKRPMRAGLLCPKLKGIPGISLSNCEEGLSDMLIHEGDTPFG